MAGKIKTEWDLGLFYTGKNDPQIDKDVRAFEKAYLDFEKKYKNNKKYLSDEKELFKALTDMEKLRENPYWKPLTYFYYIQCINTLDEEARAKSNLLEQHYRKFGNKILFFDVNLSRVSKKDQEKFLKSKQLAPFHYFLKVLFDNANYVLTEPEEKILSLESMPSSSMWVDMTEKYISKLTVSHKGKMLPLSAVNNIIAELPTQKERVALRKKQLGELQKAEDMAEAELNAVVTNKKISDELRGYREPFEATILGYENNQDTILNLVKTVTNNFEISHRFFKAKAKMLGLRVLYSADRAAKVGKTKAKFPFQKSFNTLQQVFSNTDPEFKKILDMMVSRGQIDVYPKVGKRGGAFSSHNRNLPGMIMLNHTDTLDSLMTFGHEMGHAIHSYLSEKQRATYSDYTISAAEVASTLFENFVFYHELEKMSEKEKIIALHDKIEDDIGTIFTQIACFNFETEMHNTIRQKGAMSKDELKALMNKHMQSYLGPIVKLYPDDGLSVVSWSHLRFFFYVYTYAFGKLASKALYAKYKEDNKYMSQIKKFLSAGGSDSPENIFKSIGVDVTKPDFWQKGIDSIKEDIANLEKLIK